VTPVLFDVIIIALLLLSAGLGFMRGFCNEVFTIFGWIGAVIATIYFTPVAREYGREFIEKKWLADVATAGTIFIVTLGIFSLVSYFATKTLAASKLNIVDRSLGFGFGVLRGVVLLGLTFYLYTYVFADPEQRPAFVNEARTRPFLEASANWVQVFLPEEMDNKNIASTTDSLNNIRSPKNDGEIAPANGDEKAAETSTPPKTPKTVDEAQKQLQDIIQKNKEFEKTDHE